MRKRAKRAERRKETFCFQSHRPRNSGRRTGKDQKTLSILPQNDLRKRGDSRRNFISLIKNENLAKEKKHF